MSESCGFCGLIDTGQQVESGLIGLELKQQAPSGAFESRVQCGGSLGSFPSLCAPHRVALVELLI